jgi:hypothetical protein
MSELKDIFRKCIQYSYAYGVLIVLRKGYNCFNELKECLRHRIYGDHTRCIKDDRKEKCGKT